MTLYYAITFFILGSIIGSFLNVCIYRIPRNESVVINGSHCPHCDTPIKPYDNIPILSFILLKGKCRSCHQPISSIYPIIETLTGALFVLNYLRFEITIALLLNLILTATLIVIAVIDFNTMLINDRFHIIILILAIINLILNPQQLTSALIGAFLISVPFYLIAMITGGLGGADVKLMFVAGLYLGYPSILVSFFIASLSGGLYAIYLMVYKKQGRKAQMPFGPFLCLGILLASLYGTQLINWYLQLL